MILILIVEPTTTAVGPVHVSFVSNPWARISLTKGTIESKIYIFFNQIEFNSFGGNIRIRLLSGNHMLRIVNVFFPIGIIHKFAVTAMQLPSTSC